MHSLLENKYFKALFKKKTKERSKGVILKCVEKEAENQEANIQEIIRYMIMSSK